MQALKRKAPPIFQPSARKRSRQRKLEEAVLASDAGTLHEKNRPQGGERDSSVLNDKIGVTPRRSSRLSILAGPNSTTASSGRATSEVAKPDNEDTTLVDVDAEHLAAARQELVPPDVPAASKQGSNSAQGVSSTRTARSQTSPATTKSLSANRTKIEDEFLIDLALRKMNQTSFDMLQRNSMKKMDAPTRGSKLDSKTSAKDSAKDSAKASVSSVQGNPDDTKSLQMTGCG